MSAWREDGTFIYPGEIPESGTHQGKHAVEGWFRRFFEQFPRIHFNIRDLCVRNLFDMLGNNVIAVHWKIELSNREGRNGENHGVTVITIERGKVVLAKDYIFDLGPNFKLELERTTAVKCGPAISRLRAPKGRKGLGAICFVPAPRKGAHPVVVAAPRTWPPSLLRAAHACFSTAC